MKSKIDRNDLRFNPKAAKYLEKFNMFLEAKDDVAQQTIAAVLYAYHLQGWRTKRIRRMFENIISILEMPPTINGSVEGTNLMNFLQDKYGIDFERVKLQTETKTEYLQRMFDK